MVGYHNNSKILNEWYQLFTQKHHTLSLQQQNRWEYLKKFKFPNMENKNYNKINFSEFLKKNFVFPEEYKLLRSKFEQLVFPIESHKLVFINGQFSDEFSDKYIRPWILDIDKNKSRYALFTPIQPDIFSCLTECLSDATIRITLPVGKKTKKPLYLLYINSGSKTPNQLVTSHYHHSLDIQHDTNSYIIEHFVSTNEKNSHFSGSYMSIKTGNKTILNHVKLIFENNISYHISHQDIKIGKSSNINSNTFLIFGPQFTSYQINVVKDYSQSSLYLNSLSFLSDTNIGNIRTYLEHNNRNYALSRQLHKIIACDHSIGVFNGLIKVNPDTIKTDGKMINKNLLLDQSATIHTTPKLEIYSEDVRCSHGATIGQLNTDHIFYLTTRGIPQKKAIKMLIIAFALEIIDFTNNNFLKSIILEKIEKYFLKNV